MSRHRTDHLDPDATGDFDVRQDGQIWKQPVDNHPDIGTGLRRSDQREVISAIHEGLCGFASLGRKLFDQPGIDIEFYHLALAVALQALKEGNILAIAKPHDPQQAVLAEVAADLLCHAQAHMFHDGLRLADMRGNLGNRLEYQM